MQLSVQKFKLPALLTFSTQDTTDDMTDDIDLMWVDGVIDHGPQNTGCI